MSSPVEELRPVIMGKGCKMRLFIDHSQPEDSSERNWAQTTYDGKEDSFVLAVPEHWHRHHDEIMEVIEGRMIFYLDGKELVASAGDPPILIRHGQVHGFTFIKNERVSFREKTQPAGTFKALFFQDMFQTSAMPGFLLVMRVFYDGDTYISLPGGFKILDYLFMTVVGFLARPFVPAKPITVKQMEE